MQRQKKNRKILASKKQVRKNKSQKRPEAQKYPFDGNGPEKEKLPSGLSSEEKQAKPDIILIGKSKNFKKCHTSLHLAKAALDGSDIAKAKKSYMEARDRYIGLEYAEKKELYSELMEIYNKLLNQ